MRQRQRCLRVNRRLAIALAARSLGLDRRGLQRGVEGGDIRVVNWLLYYGFTTTNFTIPSWGVSVNRCTGRTRVSRVRT